MNKNLGYTAIAYFIFRACFIGISSVALITIVHQSSWISMLIAFIIGIIPIILYYGIAKYKEDLNIIEKINYLFPKTKYLIRYLLAIIIFGITILSFWNLTNLVVSQFLSKTPTVVISLTFIIPIIFLISKQDKIIARVCLLLFFITIILFIASAIGLIGNFDISRLQPINEYSPLPGILPYVAYNVLPIFMMLIFSNKHVKKSIIYGYGISFISLLIVMIFLIAVLGIDLVTIFQYPEFHILKLAFDKLVTFRLENVLAIQWIIDIFVLTSVGLKFCNEAIGLKKVYIIPIILIILNNYLFTSNTIANKLVIYVIPYLLFFPLMILPLIIYIKIKMTKA